MMWLMAVNEAEVNRPQPLMQTDLRNEQRVPELFRLRVFRLNAYAAFRISVDFAHHLTATGKGGA
jgi:hypothetical protein